jgi:hypothetical protein
MISVRNARRMGFRLDRSYLMREAVSVELGSLLRGRAGDRTKTRFSQRLRQVGSVEDSSEGATICQWKRLSSSAVPLHPA